MRASVPTCYACLRANVPTCQRALVLWRANVPWRAYVSACLRAIEIFACHLNFSVPSKIMRAIQNSACHPKFGVPSKFRRAHSNLNSSLPSPFCDIKFCSEKFWYICFITLGCLANRVLYIEKVYTFNMLTIKDTFEV